MPPKRSAVWDFITKSDDGCRVICKICSTSYKYIMNHMRKKHIVQYSGSLGRNHLGEMRVLHSVVIQNRYNISTPTEIPNSTETSEPAPKRIRQLRLTAPTKINQKAVDEALMDMIVVDMQPLQIVENDGFKMYTQKLNEDYEIPSRKRLSQMLDKRYDRISMELKENLKNVSDIALTTDIWSSDSQKSFISVTVHFISNAKLNSLALSTSELREHHTAMNIANVSRTVFSEWQIFDKVDTIVTDNASSMKRAVIILVSHTP